MPALVAALALALQAMLATASAMPEPPPLDRFGNPLCVSGTESGRDSPAGSHAGVPECCTLGCTTAASLAPPPEDGAAFSRPLPATGPRLRPSVAGDPAGPGRTPANPRAPPPDG